MYFHSCAFHRYADDTQLYISVEPSDVYVLSSLASCLLAIRKWLSNNFFKLNDDKTEIQLLGPKTKQDVLLSKLGNLASQVKSEVTSLGVILDSDLNFTSHINRVTKTAFFSSQEYC